MRRCTFLAERQRTPGSEEGQIVIATLLGFLPLLVLVTSLLNTGRVTNGRVQLQNTADASVLSAAALEGRGMNLISAGNVAITYLLAEAISAEAFLRALDESIDVADTALWSLRAACGFGSIFGQSWACELIPIFEKEKAYLQGLKSGAMPVLPPLCALPGSRGQLAGGLLFNLSRTIEALNSQVAGTSVLAQTVAETIAVENGADAAALAPPQMTLPVMRGSFSDLGDPTRYGSRSPESGTSPSFQRGYTPILGLPWNHGPLSDAMKKYRLLMYPAFLVGGPWIYDGCIEDVYSDWFGVEHPQREPGAPVFHYEDAKRQSPEISMSSYLDIIIVTIPLESASPLDLADVIRDETRLAGLGEPSSGQYDYYTLRGISSDVDVDRSGAQRGIYHDGWYDPEREDVGSELTRVRPGLWQVGTAKVETVVENGRTLYRHTIRAIAFQMAYKGGEIDLWDPGDQPEPSYDNGARDELLPHAYLLDSVSSESDITDFRRKTFLLGFAWAEAPHLLAEKTFRPAAAKRIAYAQAELYNGTSWDLFTQDWDVRLVPASRLEDPSHSGLEALAGGEIAQLTAALALPREVLRWVNTH